MTQSKSRLWELAGLTKPREGSSPNAGSLFGLTARQVAAVRFVTGLPDAVPDVVEALFHLQAALEARYGAPFARALFGALGKAPPRPRGRPANASAYTAEDDRLLDRLAERLAAEKSAGDFAESLRLVVREHLRGRAFKGGERAATEKRYRDRLRIKWTKRAQIQDAERRRLLANLLTTPGIGLGVPAIGATDVGPVDGLHPLAAALMSPPVRRK